MITLHITHRCWTIVKVVHDCPNFGKHWDIYAEWPKEVLEAKDDIEELSKIAEQRWTGPGKYSVTGDSPAETSRPVCRHGVVGIQTLDGWLDHVSTKVPLNLMKLMLLWLEGLLLWELTNHKQKYLNRHSWGKVVSLVVKVLCQVLRVTWGSFHGLPLSLSACQFLSHFTGFALSIHQMLPLRASAAVISFGCEQSEGTG